MHTTNKHAGMPEPGGQGGCTPPSDFGRPVAPISTRRGRLCPPQYYSPPRFSDLPTSLSMYSYTPVIYFALPQCDDLFLHFNHWQSLRNRGAEGDCPFEIELNPTSSSAVEAYRITTPPGLSDLPTALIDLQLHNSTSFLRAHCTCTALNMF